MWGKGGAACFRVGSVSGSICPTVLCGGNDATTLRKGLYLIMKRWKLARWLLAAGALHVVGCSDDPAPTDAGTTTDTPVVSDTGDQDTGTPTDQGGPRDVGTDTGPGMDVVLPDAGPGPDAIVEDGATPVDVIQGEDVQVQPDGGAPDGAPPPDGAMGECTTSADCATSQNGPVCDTTARMCVRCTTAEDVCPVGNYCSNNACVPGCRNNMDCTGDARCDTTTRMCVGCVGDTDCAPGTICRMSMCVAGCSEARPCGAGQTCCGATCVNTNESATHCGACGTACTAGQSCCGGACANPQGDVNNCGACGRRCQVANATASCTMGVCGVATCNTGFANCDNDPSNGCEVDTATSATNCGACGTACTGGTNAAAACAAGACGLRCNDGFANCDNNNANGCEVNTGTSPSDCGACGTVCPTRTNASATCAAGTCGIACTTGFGNCDGDAANGCETSLTDNVSNCGTCGRTCTATNGTPSCTAGACGLASCNAGFGNCDNNAANGCETTTSDDRNNCGACGNRCDNNAICFAGVCRSVCSSPLIVCNNTCVNPVTDINHCGACGTACPTAPANATGTCSARTCVVSCNRGFGNCDNMVANGCETNLLTTVTSCGACGRTCSFPNATPTCANGACAMGACNPGFADCDGNPANGCETVVSNNINNCGACGNRCAFANATAACVSGTCEIGACASGWANCDSNTANGCEANVASNTLSCGTCGTTCTVGQACAPSGTTGACVQSCPSGTTFCSGGCVNLINNRDHCGACGNRCAAGRDCVNRMCTVVRPANDTFGGAIILPLNEPTLEFAATTVNAVNNVAMPCLGNARTAPDVFYRFTLTRREVVYFETFGANYDTALFLTNSGGTALASQTPGDTVCNDDASFCAGYGLTSAVSTVLNPGTYYLVVTGFASASGTTNIRFEHLPVSTTSLTLLPQGNSTQTGVLSGSSNVVSATCGGAGPEATFWWRTCRAQGAGTLTAETCDTANFDTVLHLANGNGFSACNDNSCGLQSRLTATYTDASRLHTLHVDNFLTTAPTGGARFTVRINRP